MREGLLVGGLVTGIVMAFYNAYPLLKTTFTGESTQGLADANFQERYGRYAHSHLIDELYLSNKNFWAMSGLVMAFCTPVVLGFD